MYQAILDSRVLLFSQWVKEVRKSFTNTHISQTSELRGAAHDGRAIRPSRSNLSKNMLQPVLNENTFKQKEYTLSIFSTFTIRLTHELYFPMELTITAYRGGVQRT